jgi:hypothetical protein
MALHPSDPVLNVQVPQPPQVKVSPVQAQRPELQV